MMTDLPNLALHRPATQSSSCMFSKGSTPEDDAVGGNNGVITGGAGFHTGYDLPAWWLVDLQKVCRITLIRIYNRLDYPERLCHLSLLVSNDRRHWTLALKKDDDSVFGGADGHPFEIAFEPGLRARYIKVQQDDRLFLHFDEFEAFGEPDLTWAPPSEELSGDDSAPILHGRAELAFEQLLDASRLGLGERPQRIELFPAMLPPPQIPAHFNVVPPVIIQGEHYQYAPPPPIRAYAVPGAYLWGSGVVTHNGRFVLPPDCLPGYFAGSVESDNHGFDIPVLLPENWKLRELVTSSLPIACPVNPNMVYGHFLLEMLPRIYLLALLRQLGVSFHVALPFSAPDWIRPFVDLYFPRSEQIWYGTTQQILIAPSVIIPSMMHHEHNFHPAFNMMIADLRARVGLSPSPSGAPRDPTSPRRIYLSRRLLDVNRRLGNEDEIEMLMERLGFTIVHPQTLSIRDQLVLFDGAEVVVAEYSSALHNTMFCRRGTRVISLDFYSWYQSAVGRLRQLPHGFVAPDDGVWRHWQTPAAADRSFRVDPAAVEAMVSLMLRLD